MEQISYSRMHLLDPYAAKSINYYKPSNNILTPLLFFLLFFPVLHIEFVYVHGTLNLLMVVQIVL